MPYTIGLKPASDAFLTACFFVQFTTAVIIILCITSFLSCLPDDKSDSPIRLPVYSLFAITPFFKRRFDFLNWAFNVTGETIFQFQLLKNTVVVVSGDSARQIFFSAKGLDLTEGFKILSGAIPMVRGVTSGLQSRRISLIHKRLAAVQKSDTLTQLMPCILEDSRRLMEAWGSAGTFDPFDNIYAIFFQATLRSLSSSEISDNPAMVNHLRNLYQTLDTGTTPATVLLPWFPTPAMIKKLWATKKIYGIVVNAIGERERSGVSRNDTLQMLLDHGDERLVIVGFIMGLLIAGARATGTTACWMFIFLSGYPEWRERAKAEVEAILQDHLETDSSPYSLSAHLASVPLETWETETPVLDSIVRETLRVAQPHTAMRRNLGPEIHINGKLIPTGAYVVYPFSDVHLDSGLYPDPWKFDPTRKAVTDTPFGYVGWGAGKTTCLGTRLAKMELKLIAALFLLGFKSDVVNGEGKSACPPTPNWNDILLCRPPIGTANIKYTRSDVPL